MIPRSKGKKKKGGKKERERDKENSVEKSDTETWSWSLKQSSSFPVEVNNLLMKECLINFISGEGREKKRSGHLFFRITGFKSNEAKDEGKEKKIPFILSF